MKQILIDIKFKILWHGIAIHLERHNTSQLSHSLERDPERPVLDTERPIKANG